MTIQIDDRTPVIIGAGQFQIEQLKYHDPLKLQLGKTQNIAVLI